MIEQYLRPLFQKYGIQPVLVYIQDKLSPNTVTLLSGGLGLLAFFMLIINQKLLAITFLLLSGYMDILDGSLARATNTSTPIGTVLDIMTDRVVEASVIIGLWALNPYANSLGCILMLASVLLCVTSFLVVGIFSDNDSAKSFYYSPGLIERAEAFIFFILMIGFQPYFQWLSVIFSLLVALTALIRIIQFCHQEQFYAQYKLNEKNNA